MSTETNPIEIFLREAPEVAQAFNGLTQAVGMAGALDEKTRQLMFIAMKAALGDKLAVTFHVPMARQAGATRQEVIDAIVLTVPVVGIQAVTAMLPDAVRICDTD